MVTVRRRVDRIPFAPVVALMFAATIAAFVAAAPIEILERAVALTGLPQFVSFARPPLGLTARLLAVVLAFGVVATVLWLALTPFERWLDRDRRRRTPWRDDGYATVDFGAPAPVDARRKPIFATDELGAPLMSEEALAKVAPLDPDPVLEAPVTDAELVAVEAVEPEPWVPTTSPEGETSIHALIARLEAGLARRGGGRDPDPGAATAAPLELSGDWAVVDDLPRARRSDDGLTNTLSGMKKFAWR